MQYRLWKCLEIRIGSVQILLSYCCGTLEYENVKRNVDNGGLACKVSERAEDSLGAIRVIYLNKESLVVTWVLYWMTNGHQLGLKNRA